MEDPKTSFCSSKFPRANGIISLKAIDNLGTRRQKVSPALVSVISLSLIVQLAVTSLTWSQEYNKSCRQSSILTHDRFPLHSRTHPRDCASTFFNVCDLEEHTRVGTLIVATIYLQLIQNRYMFRSFTVLQCSHQHCVQPVAKDVEVVGYL